MTSSPRSENSVDRAPAAGAVLDVAFVQAGLPARAGLMFASLVLSQLAALPDALAGVLADAAG